MDLRPLLRKEAISARRNLGLVLVLLILIPGAIAAGTLVFERTIPQDVPVAVVAEDGATADEVNVTRTGIDSLATPEVYDSEDEALRALRREEVYILVRVPPGLFDPDAEPTFTVVSDNGFVPFDEPVNESAGVIERSFDDSLPSDVSVRHERTGQPHTLSEFLVPTGVFAFVVLYALVYLPYQVHSERAVLDRLQTESRLDVVVASKLLFTGALLAVPVGVVAAVTAGLGYDVAVVRPLALGVVALTFLALGAVGLTVLFALRLRRTALFANLGLSLGVFALSSLVYPVGFFSTTQRTVARLMPTHYAAVTLRSAMLRDVPASLYADYLLWLCATALAALVALKIALVGYRRRQ